MFRPGVRCVAVLYHYGHVRCFYYTPNFTRFQVNIGLYATSFWIILFLKVQGAAQQLSYMVVFYGRNGFASFMVAITSIVFS